MIAYKVCRVKRKKFISAHTDNELILRYEIGKTTEAKAGGIFLYKKKKDALRHVKRDVNRIDQRPPTIILRGTVRKKEKLPTPRSVAGSLSEANEMKKVWKTIPYRGYASVPDGTVIYRTFTPREVVYEGV